MVWELRRQQPSADHRRPTRLPPSHREHRIARDQQWVPSVVRGPTNAMFFSIVRQGLADYTWGGGGKCRIVQVFSKPSRTRTPTSVRRSSLVARVPEMVGGMTENLELEDNGDSSSAARILRVTLTDSEPPRIWYTVR